MINLRARIHEIQNGIENVHGDVAYGERQYLFLIRDWIVEIVEADLLRAAPNQWRYQAVESDIFGESAPEITIWIESHEYIRGYNQRSKELLDTIEKIILEEYDEKKKKKK